MQADMQTPNARLFTDHVTIDEVTLPGFVKPLAWAVVVAMLFGGQAFAGDAADLAKAKGCFECHKTNGDSIGPSFHDIAKRFQGLENARPMLVRVVTKGTGIKGVPHHWGTRKMPPATFRAPVSEQDAEQLIDYVLATE